MAIAAVTEAETRLCGNCKKDIPAVNFIIHEIHCSRNIEVCCYCSESIPKAEMKNHIESEHVQVTCKCRMKMENSLLKDHEASACPLRPALCQYCDIQLTFKELLDHEVYCGARTELCGGCGRNIMVKDLREHPRVCGQEVKQVRGSRAVPRYEDEDAVLRALRGVRRQLGSENELEQLGRNESTRSAPDEEWNPDLDYALALSLQNEDHQPKSTAAEIPSDLWENCYTKESVSSAYRSDRDELDTFCDSFVPSSMSNHGKNEIIMLPCEFCEELYPAEDLILHQTGCNPASAFASFSKRSSSPNPWEYDGLRAGGSKGFGPLSSSQPQDVQAEEDIIIPCEFCGIQLEEETLFHHQHHCDLRPASPATTFPSWQPPSPQASRERRGSAELARRRARHQGDVSAWSTGSFRQQELSCPARGATSRSSAAHARNVPLASSMRAGDAPASRGKPRKASGNEGRPRNRDTGEPACGITPRVRPAQNCHSEGFTSNLRASPRTSNGGGRSPGAWERPGSLRCRNTKAKARSPARGQPEEQRPTTNGKHV
ncbi:TRAF-type zinc finger domain-containing protein 1 [Melopsittacus undulatus]|uniref:TRAF-type zinc finger domain-containing protein 1 n=1 Tax=Melopsittacus undulatus TaxID=13146 RepID=A0A8C6K1C1_MELUD|nr:TRAF-type zinc finger domain-containing protein 1 [Melopsittacus undulatus]